MNEAKPSHSAAPFPRPSSEREKDGRQEKEGLAGRRDRHTRV